MGAELGAGTGGGGGEDLRFGVDVTGFERVGGVTTSSSEFSLSSRRALPRPDERDVDFEDEALRADLGVVGAAAGAGATFGFPDLMAVESFFS